MTPNTEPIKISGDADHRFSRQELIGWWEQEKLTMAKALVIGAGALGNEILKNLALLGVGKVLVVDLDKIEISNLSRSILYRESDCGSYKATVAAQRAADIFPEMKLNSLVGNVAYDLGLGVYKWADVILAGLDNREARVAINQAAAKVGKPWIDGAIERLDGIARVFNPASGPCYECTMSEIDWKMLEARRSCALLTRDEMASGKVPTTPTTSSIVAGIQVQEAVKMIHGLESMSGQGFVFDGMSHQSYMVNYTKLEDCPSHDAFESITPISSSVADITVGELLEKATNELGPDALIELNHDMLESLYCSNCDKNYLHRSSLSNIKESDAVCSDCGEQCTPNLYHSIDSSSELLDLTLEEIGVPAWDIITVRSGMRQIAFELSGDRSKVLGDLA